MKVATIGFTLCAVLSMLLSPSINAKAEELYSYEVYGQNKSSGLYVAGLMQEVDKSGHVKAKILDRLDVFDECLGTWQGKGIAKVECSNKNEYILKVVER